MVPEKVTDVLVDRGNSGIDDRLPKRGNEPVGEHDAERPTPERTRGRVDGVRDAEVVVASPELLRCRHEGCLAFPPIAGTDRGLQRRSLREIERCVRRAEPLRVRRITARLQEAESHQVARDRSRDQSRAEVVAAKARPPDEVLVLGDPLPVAAHRVQPDVVRVPSERLAHMREVAAGIGEDLAARELEQALRRRRQPVDGAEAVARVGADPVPKVGPKVQHCDTVRNRPVVDRGNPRVSRVVGRAEMRGESGERSW